MCADQKGVLNIKFGRGKHFTSDLGARIKKASFFLAIEALILGSARWGVHFSAICLAASSGDPAIISHRLLFGPGPTRARGRVENRSPSPIVCIDLYGFVRKRPLFRRLQPPEGRHGPSLVGLIIPATPPSCCGGVTTITPMEF